MFVLFTLIVLHHAGDAIVDTHLIYITLKLERNLKKHKKCSFKSEILKSKFIPWIKEFKPKEKQTKLYKCSSSSSIYSHSCFSFQSFFLAQLKILTLLLTGEDEEGGDQWQHQNSSPTHF